MFSRKYECVIIFDVQMLDEAREAILKDVSGVITSTAGQVSEVAPYGIRTLEVDLKGRTRGDYRIVRFTSGPETLQKLDRMLRMKEEVLRYLITKHILTKPKRQKVRKPKPVSAESAPSEGEVAHGKSEQSVSDREHHPAA